MQKEEKRFYKNIMWFDNRHKFKIESLFEYLEPQRKVSRDTKYKNGVFYSEKCKRNIQYESGLELAFIEKLEQLDNVLFYYEQPVKIKYPRGKIKRGYYCDFGIYLDTGEFVLVEIKELSMMLDDRVQLKSQALVEYCSKKGFGFLLTDGEHTFNDLMSKLRKVKNNPEFEKAILSHTEQEPLYKEDYKQVAKECNATQNDLLKVILKHDLRYNARGFKLQKGKLNRIFRQVFVEKKKYDDIAKYEYRELFKER